MFGPEFTSKRDVLKVVGERTREKMETTFRTLENELWLSADAATSHLKRLWRERLIKSEEFPSDFVEAMKLGQSIRDLRFRISRRGLERLKHWRELEEKDGWLR